MKINKNWETAYYIIEFVHSEQIHGRKETNVSPNNADTSKTRFLIEKIHAIPTLNSNQIFPGVKRDVRMNLQNDKTEAQQESDTTEYSAAANGKSQLNNSI